MPAKGRLRDTREMARLLDEGKGRVPDGTDEQRQQARETEIARTAAESVTERESSGGGGGATRDEIHVPRGVEIKVSQNFK